MKHRVFIYGSCVSRDSYEYFDQEQFELAEYVARQSAISAYTRPVELMAPPLLDSPFQQRMVSGDFNSSLPTLLRDTADTIDLFLVDLTDERLGVYILPDGSVVTRSVELINSGAENSLPPGSHHIPFGSEAHLQYWSQGLEAVASLLQAHHPRAGVALLDVPWASTSETDEPTPASFGLTAVQANEMYRPYIEIAARILNAQVVSLEASKVRSGLEHPWGDAPFHYATSVYRDVASLFASDRDVATNRAIQTNSAATSAVQATTAKATSKPSTLLQFDASNVDHLPAIEDHIKIVGVAHGTFANGDENLMSIAYRNPVARETVYHLAALGFHMYRSDATESVFVRDTHIPDFWHEVKNGNLLYGQEGLIHTVERPPAPLVAESLIVVFSSMANPYNKASLTRYMEPNYRSLPKHAPASSAILRIADLDAVVGGFYLDTHRNPQRTGQVRSLILRIAAELGISEDQIVVYGASKGGTAALYYGATNGWSTVSVDPIVDDEHYETAYNDSHWTAGPLFVHRKRDLFRKIGSQLSETPNAHLTVITSPRSPQYQYIAGIMEEFPASSLHFIRTHHPDITDHPHVSPRTLTIASAMISLYAIGSRPLPRVIDIDRGDPEQS